MIANPYTVAGIILVILLAALGVQTYRVQGLKGEVALWEQKDDAAKAAAAKQALHDAKNKERTDAQYTLDLAAAHAAGVRAAPRVFLPPADSSGGEVCFDTGELNRELTDWAKRFARRLSGVAQQAEEVAAAYRACQAFVLGED